MADDRRLQHIQSLQFSDRAAAERLLLDFVRGTFPALDVARVELRPLAVSLNSFNGFLTMVDGRRLFFKSHVEPHSIVSEYYNSTLLAEAGYPIIHPLYASTDYGKQLLVYDLIDSPSVFDVARQIETRQTGQSGITLDALRDAQHEADRRLVDIYRRTLRWQSADEAASAPVHQLFFHRLGARYDSFYRDQPFVLPGATLNWEDVLARRWHINGVTFQRTLGEALDMARRVLQPSQAGWSVVGHGDAHNGNVFLTPSGLVYFDPAFGGRHHPLLDLTKTLFHNVFATWMYHPADVGKALHITWEDDGSTLRVRHNYQPSPVRELFFASKVTHTLRPLLAHLATLEPRESLTAQAEMLRSALLCCPLLTMNLADRSRFSPEIALLGLCYAVEMGCPGHPDSPRTAIDAGLDAAFAASRD